MVGPVFLPALAALMVQGDLPPEVGAFRTAPLASDSAALAGAISGQRLELALRGVGTAIHAEARPAEDGCATLIAASTPGAVGTWTRLLRWHDVAWTGVLPEGRVLVAFYEHEGRLPGDRLVLAPADPAAFRATLTRVSQTCRAEAAEAERVLSGDYTGSRSCYFARHPGLELVETTEPGPQTEPTRAVITVLAHETPEAELRLLVERAAKEDGGGWGRPEVAFTVAGAGLKDMSIGAVRFALDGAPVNARHSIALYNETRLRIRMDPFAGDGPTDSGDSFYRRLAASGRARVTLVDRAGVSRAVLNFDAGPALAAARRVLDAAAWSCAVVAPMPPPAAQWRLAE